MAAKKSRVVWLLAVGVAQVALTVAALELCLVRTVITRTGMSGGKSVHGCYEFTHGYPVSWSAGEAPFTRHLRFKPVREKVQPLAFAGTNLAVPAAILGIALALPTVLTGVASRLLRRVCGHPPVPSSRGFRLACVILFASLATVVTAWLEAETRGWRGAMMWGASPWTARPPGDWVADTQTYSGFIGHVDDGRAWIERHLPGADTLLEGNWQAQTRLSLVSFVSGVIFGCALFRPWRRARNPHHDPASVK